MADLSPWLDKVTCGDCIEVLKELPDGCADAVVTDPPYPEIDRPYGRMTEPEWHAMMDSVVAEVRRVLTPTGSAVFVLQPNSERVGRMRPWLWEFMAKWTREWGMVQDAWWWNFNAAPTAHCHRDIGLMRPSLKACVWLGETDCWRNQESVLWELSDATRAADLSDRALTRSPSGMSMRQGRCHATAIERGGSTPFNVLPAPNNNSTTASSAYGHGAGTPLALCRWWTRYICPPGGVVLDPFMGAGTVGLAAIAEGRRFVGIERDPGYCDIANARIAEAPHPAQLSMDADAG